MDANLPPLICAQCNEAINVGESLVAINEQDSESGETTMIAKLVVHDGCLFAWKKDHDDTHAA